MSPEEFAKEVLLSHGSWRICWRSFAVTCFLKNRWRSFFCHMFPEESLTKFFLSHLSWRICCHNSQRCASREERDAPAFAVAVVIVLRCWYCWSKCVGDGVAVSKREASFAWFERANPLHSSKVSVLMHTHNSRLNLRTAESKLTMEIREAWLQQWLPSLVWKWPRNELLLCVQYRYENQRWN